MDECFQFFTPYDSPAQLTKKMRDNTKQEQRRLEQELEELRQQIKAERERLGKAMDR